MARFEKSQRLLEAAQLREGILIQGRCDDTTKAVDRSSIPHNRLEQVIPYIYTLGISLEIINTKN